MQAETLRSNRDRDDVVADCLPKVLSHLSQSATAGTKGDGYIERIGAHEHQVGSLDGDIGATNRHTEIGLSQGRCVADSVTDHGDLSTVWLQFGDLGGFVLRQHVGDDPVDTQLRSDPSGGRLVVAATSARSSSSAMPSTTASVTSGSPLVKVPCCP